MCDHVTPLIRTACSDPFVGIALIGRILQKIRERLQDNPEATIRFSLFYGEAVGPTGWVNIRAELLRKDFERIPDILKADHNGDWNEETLMYEGRLSDESLFDVSANAADKEVFVVFW